MNNKNKNIEKFSKLALKELKLTTEVEKWTFKQLGDFLIQRIWATKFDKIGTLESVVLDRVINELFIAHDLDSVHKNWITKPNKDVKVPKFDLLTEGYDPDKIKN